MSTTAIQPDVTTSAVAGGRDGEPVIRMRQVGHSFGEGELRRKVLFDNNLDIRRGEIVIMTGPSGSGKTTLLTLIGTLRAVQEGSLQVLGRELAGAEQQERASLRRDIGFIFQAHNLFASLTALENVCMAVELFESSQRRAQEKSIQMLTRLGLEHRIHYKPAKLSGGQKQRVAIARALVHGPRIVLADEPTASLDEESGRDVVKLFQEVASRDQTTILMVTHDNRILDVADRIVTMVDGRIKSNVVVSETSVICEFLKQCPLFAQLLPSTLARVADQMKREEHPPGTPIIRQGDLGDKFYIVRDGLLEVTVADGTTSRVVKTLGKGDFFGEVALMTGGARTATVTSLTPAELYVLGNDTFQSIVATSASFEEELRRVLFERQ